MFVDEFFKTSFAFLAIVPHIDAEFIALIWISVRICPGAIDSLDEQIPTYAGEWDVVPKAKLGFFSAVSGFAGVNF